MVRTQRPQARAGYPALAARRRACRAQGGRWQPGGGPRLQQARPPPPPPPPPPPHLRSVHINQRRRACPPLSRMQGRLETPMKQAALLLACALLAAAAPRAAATAYASPARCLWLPVLLNPSNQADCRYTCRTFYMETVGWGSHSWAAALAAGALSGHGCGQSPSAAASLATASGSAATCSRRLQPPPNAPGAPNVPNAPHSRGACGLRRRSTRRGRWGREGACRRATCCVASCV